MIPTFHSELNELCEKYDCSHFGLNPGGFWGYKQVWPLKLLAIFLHIFFRGYSWAPRTKFQILRCKFLGNCKSFSTIHNIWGFELIWGRGGQNNKYFLFENCMHKLVVGWRIVIWDQMVAWIKKARNHKPFKKNGGHSS